MNEQYIGHPDQYYGVEEHRLVGGRKDGMRIFEVRNGKGLSFTVSADRGADITRLAFMGWNFGFFSPCGYVSPQYYDQARSGFPKSFTAGFMTTCGLASVGGPCYSETGELLPFHGTVSNTPAEQVYYTEEDDELCLHAVLRDAQIFGHKLSMNRRISCSLVENVISITDTVKNVGDKVSPLMILYHINAGYPLLDENSVVYIPTEQVTAYNQHAQDGIDRWGKTSAPQKGTEEQCYFHKITGKGAAGLFQPSFGKGMVIEFDSRELDCFTQWKMMGYADYAMGFEPGNCYPTGTEELTRYQLMQGLSPGDTKQFQLSRKMVDGVEDWNRLTGSV